MVSSQILKDIMCNWLPRLVRNKCGESLLQQDENNNNLHDWD